MIAEPSDDEAVVTSVCTASDPASSVALVRLRVAYVHTSDAVIPPPLVSVRVPYAQISATRVPKVVRERDVDDHTAVGMVEARDDEAVRIAEVVLALMTAASELDAVPTTDEVLALIAV